MQALSHESPQTQRHGSPSRLFKRLQRRLPASYWGRRALGLILFVTILLFALLGNQARVAQQGFLNAQLEYDIRSQTRLNAQRREELLKRSDLAKVRAQAQALGLVFPAAGQLVYVDVPRQDAVLIGEGDHEDALQQQARMDEALIRALHRLNEAIQGRSQTDRVEVLTAGSLQRAAKAAESESIDPAEEPLEGAEAADLNEPAETQGAPDPEPEGTDSASEADSQTVEGSRP